MRAARWRAARYGISADLIDVVGTRSAAATDVVGQLLMTLATALDTWGELELVTDLVRQVIGRGTSAQRQRRVHARSRSLDDVVGWLIEETSRI